MTTTTSRLEGLTTSVAIKAPCKAVSDSNITLSGEQTIDGVSCVDGDRVLVNGQTNGAENGIWVVSYSAWTRAADWNGARDVVQGTQVRVTSGGDAGVYRVTTANPITIGTTPVSLSVIVESNVTSLSQLEGTSDDVSQGTSNLYYTLIERNKLLTIEEGAQVNLDIVAGSNITVTGGTSADWTIAGGVSLDGISNVDYGSATVNGGRYAFQYDTTGGGVYNDLLLGSISEQDANAVTITGGNATLTSGTFTDVVTEDLQASGSSGVVIKNSGGTAVLTVGPANGDGSTFAGQVNGTTANLSGACTIGGGAVITASSGDALRVTNTGSGNSLVIEDSSNPDATPTLVDSTGRIIVGHTGTVASFGGSTLAGLQLHSTGSGSSINMTRYSGDVSGPIINMGKGRDTVIGGTTIVQDDDTLGQINFYGADGTDTATRGAFIAAQVDGTPGSNDLPARLVFGTTPDGSSSTSIRLTILSDGGIVIGNLKSGINQAAAGAAVNEMWVDTSASNVIKLGV